jgi:hypothetical protein
MSAPNPGALKRITRTVRLEASLWTQLARKAAQASLDAGRRISVNALVRRALIDHCGLQPPEAAPDASAKSSTGPRRTP